MWGGGGLYVLVIKLPNLYVIINHANAKMSGVKLFHMLLISITHNLFAG